MIDVDGRGVMGMGALVGRPVATDGLGLGNRDGGLLGVPIAGGPTGVSVGSNATGA